MSRAPILVIADDLTGAAEIGGIGHRHGLKSGVVTDTGALPGDAGLLVFDTDSRLDEPDVAAEKISRLGKILESRSCTLIYKKTDSVLRGPVRAELEALARALGWPRVLLVPANPSLGRTIESGRYAIRGTPLHETAFARDPHHPATSSDVLQLLGGHGSLPTSIGESRDAHLAAGIVIGNAPASSDVATWTQRVGAGVLPAGGAEFFSALLVSRGFAVRSSAGIPRIEGPVLVVSGTTSPTSGTRQQAAASRLATLPMPGDPIGWVSRVQPQLTGSGRILVVHEGPLSDDPTVAAKIRGGFASLVRPLISRQALRHLVVEGGATAASIAHELGWRELRVVHEWAPGVTSLRPVANPAITFTLKPGSYAWPPALWQTIANPDTKPLPA
jgi:uncharacterized protein YgbK (DUF1537 family)